MHIYVNTDPVNHLFGWPNTGRANGVMMLLPSPTRLMLTIQEALSFIRHVTRHVFIEEGQMGQSEDSFRYAIGEPLLSSLQNVKLSVYCRFHTNRLPRDLRRQWVQAMLSKTGSHICSKLAPWDGSPSTYKLYYDRSYASFTLHEQGKLHFRRLRLRPVLQLLQCVNKSLRTRVLHSASFQNYVPVCRKLGHIQYERGKCSANGASKKYGDQKNIMRSKNKYSWINSNN